MGQYEQIQAFMPRKCFKSNYYSISEFFFSTRDNFYKSEMFRGPFYKKHHGRSALNSSFVPENRLGTQQNNKFYKVTIGGEKMTIPVFFKLWDF